MKNKFNFLLKLLIFLISLPFLSHKVKAQLCWKTFSPRYGHCIGIDASNKLWGWGLNLYGVLGVEQSITNAQMFTVPQQIGTDNNWQVISDGAEHALGLKADGTLWAWGLYSFYLPASPIPIQINNGSTWKAISAGWDFSMAIKSDGTLWGWGYNNHGQLGNGTTSYGFQPAQVGTDHDWLYVTASYYCVLAIKANGTLWAWGNNEFGQLGDGTFIDKYLPIQIGTDTNWKSISANYSHCLGLKTDGTLSAWGTNESGQLGDGSNTTKNRPVQIGSDIDWKEMSASVDHSVALKENGSLWAWGNNQFGQLGKGYSDYNMHSQPEQSGIQTNWQRIFAGQRCTYGKKDLDSSFAWGINQYGELCNGTRTYDNVVPEPIVCPLTIVPVTLLSFAAQKQRSFISVSWQTTSEINFFGFELEHASSSNNFKKIGTIVSEGTSSLGEKYNFTDSAPDVGVNYYRLKLIDKNGGYTYSKTVIVNFENKTSVILPNPAYSYIVIKASVDLKAIEIANLFGEIFKRITPAQSHQYDISMLPKGSYFVRLIYADKYEILKLLKL